MHACTTSVKYTTTFKQVHQSLLSSRGHTKDMFTVHMYSEPACRMMSGTIALSKIIIIVYCMFVWK